MKTKIFFLLIFTLLTFGLFSKILRRENHIFKVSDIELIKKLQLEDSTYKIEYMVAIKFHEKLNDYRKSMYLNPLDFSYAHWIASRNHSYWMSQNCPPECQTTKFASHYQTRGTKYFTGLSPEERLSYVSNKCIWTGENVLSDPSFRKRKIENSEQIAEEIAQHALNLWITSTGHHRMMLLPRHKVVGTAFIIGLDGRIWATSLFGDCGLNLR